jgi:hypothetical protein
MIKEKNIIQSYIYYKKNIIILYENQVKNKWYLIKIKLESWNINIDADIWSWKTGNKLDYI